MLLTDGVKILAKLDEATEEGITLSYEEKQAVEGKRKKTTGDGHPHLPFSRSNGRKEWLDFK